MGSVLITLDCLRKNVGGRKLKVMKVKDKMGNLTGFDPSQHDVKGTKFFDRLTGGADAVEGLLEPERNENAATTAGTYSGSKSVSASPVVRRASAAAAKRRSKNYADKGDSYDGAYGLSAEVRAKMDAKYDYELEEVIQEWIEDTLGIEFDAPFAEELQSGVILCRLMNEVEGKQKRISEKKISKSSGKFMQMENINLFLTACREFGLPESGMFSTVDLHEQKNMMAVLTTLDGVRRGVGGRKMAISRKKHVGSAFDPSIVDHKSSGKLDKIVRLQTIEGEQI